MGQALYRKYRSKSLGEVVGQEHITKTLEQALKQGRISHAYLFTGPRGVGKTSVARILAHAINDLPYTDDSAHMDIIEIDAASNRRIDEIRELREKVYVAPTSAKYKVYIIDEVHMLTREAFNALLKTLEEPPAHVVFILATTDAHKLPETIISRTQRFSFKPASPGEVVNLLKRIAKEEKINISGEALELMAAHGDGSFRDSVSLLDQASHQADKIELPDVQRLLGLPPAEAIDGLLKTAINGSDTAALMRTITALYDQGYQAAAIAKRLGQVIRSQLLAGTVEPETALRLLSRLIEVPASHDPERFLEITLLAIARTSPANVAPKENSEAVSEKPKIDDPGPAKSPVAGEKPASTSAKAAAKAKLPSPPATSQKPLDETVWPEILQALKQQHNTLYGVVRMAQPDFSEAGTLGLVFAFAFHQKRIDEDANRQKLADIIRQLTGQTVTIKSRHDKSTVTPPAANAETGQTLDLNLTAISNIFGDAELLES
jgi:DNA polymerase-3 subunit gamma/tau